MHVRRGCPAQRCSWLTAELRQEFKPRGSMLASMLSGGPQGRSALVRPAGVWLREGGPCTPGCECCRGWPTYVLAFLPQTPGLSSSTHNHVHIDIAARTGAWVWRGDLNLKFEVVGLGSLTPWCGELCGSRAEGHAACSDD